MTDECSLRIRLRIDRRRLTETTVATLHALGAWVRDLSSVVGRVTIACTIRASHFSTILVRGEVTIRASGFFSLLPFFFFPERNVVLSSLFSIEQYLVPRVQVLSVLLARLLSKVAKRIWIRL